MQLLDDLSREHELIDAALGAFRTWAARLEAASAPLSDGTLFLRFFRTYAGKFHHEREEEILVPALVMEAQLPASRGPIRVMLEDHHAMAAVLDRVGTLLEGATLAPEQRVELAGRVIAYSHLLWHHIDAENTVLFPEADVQLRRNGVRELPSRAPSPDEAEAAEAASRLIVRYPPMEPDVPRGEGCALCPAYGDRCSGVEREWWNEWQWEEFDDHIGAS
jgi:hemerythrin-like domain-containing protein